jgi:hypothetical protein
MKTLVFALGTLLLAGALGGSPVGATVTGGTGTSTSVTLPTDGQSITFNTALTPDYRGAGEYDGVLHLTFGPHGIVNGWYRDADVGIAHPIVGGLDGDKLWLDLGRTGFHVVNSNYDGGKIVGSTYFDNQTYTFVATPTTKQQ